MRYSVICYRCFVVSSLELRPMDRWLFGFSLHRIAQHKTNGRVLLSWMFDSVCLSCDPDLR